VPLKRSPDYGRVRPRVAQLKPIDAWQDEGLHYFVFELKPDPQEPEGTPPPIVVFTMHPEMPRPVAGVIVAPTADGKDARITNLTEPDNPYTIALS
jgi:hypothetical protein